MPPIFELLLPRRPLSHQAKNSTNKQTWKDYNLWKSVPDLEASSYFKGGTSFHGCLSLRERPMRHQ